MAMSKANKRLQAEFEAAERQPAGAESRDAENVRLRGENARLREALEMIATDPHCSYRHPQTGDGPYGTGVADGHRCAAKQARAALQQKGASDAD